MGIIDHVTNKVSKDSRLVLEASHLFNKLIKVHKLLCALTSLLTQNKNKSCIGFKIHVFQWYRIKKGVIDMNKFFTRGLISGVLATTLIGGLIQLRFKSPEIVDYQIVYAGQGDTLTSICQKSYSDKMRNKIGIETLIDNCIEETTDGKLKIGERILVPVYKEEK